MIIVPLSPLSFLDSVISADAGCADSAERTVGFVNNVSTDQMWDKVLNPDVFQNKTSPVRFQDEQGASVFSKSVFKMHI